MTNYESNDGYSTVDDFLANYKHGIGSIRDFLRSLEDPISCQKFDGHVEFSYAPFKVLTTTASDVCAQPILSKSMSEAKISRSTNITTRPTHELLIKRPRHKPTKEERIENRKRQNREAQRRYREKSMLKKQILEQPNCIWDLHIEMRNGVFHNPIN